MITFFKSQPFKLFCLTFFVSLTIDTIWSEATLQTNLCENGYDKYFTHHFVNVQARFKYFWLRIDDFILKCTILFFMTLLHLILYYYLWLKRIITKYFIINSLIYLFTYLLIFFVVGYIIDLHINIFIFICNFN